MSCATSSCGLAEAQIWHWRGVPGLGAPHGHGIVASTQSQHPELCQPQWLWHGSAKVPTAAGARVALLVSLVTTPSAPCSPSPPKVAPSSSAAARRPAGGHRGSWPRSATVRSLPGRRWSAGARAVQPRGAGVPARPSPPLPCAAAPGRWLGRMGSKAPARSRVAQPRPWGNGAGAEESHLRAHRALSPAAHPGVPLPRLCSPGRSQPRSADAQQGWQPGCPQPYSGGCIGTGSSWTLPGPVPWGTQLLVPGQSWGSEGMVLTCVAQSQKSPSPARDGKLQCPLLSTARSRGTQQGLDPPLELVLAAHIPQEQPEGSCCPKPSMPAPLALPPAQDWAQPHCSEEPPRGTAGCHGLPHPQGPSRDPPRHPHCSHPMDGGHHQPCGWQGLPRNLCLISRIWINNSLPFPLLASASSSPVSPHCV